MESSVNYRGLKKYEALLKTICQMEDYSVLNDNEWEGCLGVACVMAFIEDVTPNIFSLSKHLDIPHYDIHLQKAFDRLRINGVFGNKYGAKYDPALTGDAKGNYWYTGSEIGRNAWCNIAGMASGYIGMIEINNENKNILESESVDDTIVVSTQEV